ncbi:plasmid stabilization system (plasmid) [Thalassoporum mexicanum PCC 7367]|uniref:type II toxin-antitoxin system RelE/ParE family toxin n=1 Tax=Thalassoporum mexicanum TaxID=3457544 RepID=UPI00029FE91F|nr:type II toxin-antitoxin system RelE/ParE family toxin [Pseudanabaena sp. PCC 7367]AFY71991.1 plasmid stabilization system [Pseudanabaena sp. PCC 7367]
MPRIRWSTQSEADLARHYHFLAAKSLSAAVQAIETIYKSAANLSSMPYMGLVIDEKSGLRKWPVAFGKSGYVLHYKVIDDEIVIDAVYAGRENRMY